MKLTFHPRVYSDVDEIMMHYEEISGTPLADEFYDEFIRFVRQAAADPGHYPIRRRDVRRVNFRRFPYHVLFRVVGNYVRILVVRHHRRHPTFGTSRR